MVGLFPMTQEQALTALKTGANVFLTGEPGAGKTYVLNQYIAWLEAAGLTVAVTASTGIAATHIGGMTIHSWSGIGIRDTLSRYDLDQITTKEKLVKRFERVHVLVIDEISMLEGTILDMVDLVLKVARGKSEPFGGVQVVFVGDFFQLPPITKPGSTMRYAFASRAWENARPLICYLSEQWRHEDELLSNLLGAIRRNEVEEEHYTLLNEQKEIAYEGIVPTRLYTHNADVDAVNLDQLRAIGGSGRVFTMSSKGSKPLVEGLMRTCLSPQALTLKEDAMVMCTKNNFEAGYVNGTLGRIVSFDPDGGWPVVETAGGRRVTIEPLSWEVSEEGKILASITQVPLRLAWAITIHKSQGMSLDAAEIDLTKAFVYGQGYVALSRVRTLAGLKVLGIGGNALSVDPKVVTQDARFRTECADLQSTFTDMGPEEIAKLQGEFVTNLGGRVPQTGDKAPVRTVGARKQKESTTALTKDLLQTGKSITDIAVARGLAESTIYSHLEELLIDGQITTDQVQKALVDVVNWKKGMKEITAAINTHTDVALKPLFEALDGKYDYNQLRILRAAYRSTHGEASF